MRGSGRAGLAETASRLAALALWPKLLALSAGALLALLLVAGLGGAYLASSQASCQREPEVTGSVRGVPKKYVPFYLAASRRYELGSRGPAILAGIHRVETDFGTLDAPGVRSGVNAYGCCAGPMQFYISPFPGVLGADEHNSSTWGRYGVDANGDGRKSAYDAEDAIHSAARYLAALGAPGDWHGAIYGYNHAEWYVADVLDYAAEFGGFEDVQVSASVQCRSDDLPAGPAQLQKSVRLYRPRAYKLLPQSVMAGGRSAQVVDERVWAAAVWALREYDMAVTAAREAGHASHGDGTSLDLVPASATTISA